MKKLLITGKNSYVGTSFESWLNKANYCVNTLDMKSEDWKQFDFSQYDAIIHVAGIVHSPKALPELYFRVNRDLACEVAKKAKEQQVKHFIFISTMAVYGQSDVMGKKSEITKNSSCNSKSPYGQSKLEAEKLLQELQDDKFILSIIRPPMIYGANCTGNYQMLRKITLKYGIIPDMQNERSMIYIDNLCEFLKRLVDSPNVDSSSLRLHHEFEKGIFCPQDAQYFNTSEVMQLIAQANNRKFKKSKLFACAVKCGAVFVGKFKKAFGNLTYAAELSGSLDYCKFSFEEAIKKTEKDWR